MTDEATTCTMCGESVAARDKTCASCGAIIVPPSEPPPAPNPSPASAPTGRRNVIALAVLVVAGVLAAVLMNLRAGPDGKELSPREFREARQQLEGRWAEVREQYFSLIAEQDLVAREDTEARRVHLEAGTWEKLDRSARKRLLSWMALKLSVKNGDAAVGRLELVEGETVVATYDPR